MSSVVFIGPTLSVEEARDELDAVYLPPASQGDIYRIALKKPTAIGIVDGYFERMPSVWHKEILWAMSQGIHVYGSASMGALRAAELAFFGMEGVGRIFEAFRGQILEDDDEVAVAHGAAESGFLNISEALVNIRFTLEKAESEGILSSKARTELISMGKSLFYPDRSYPTILKLASNQGFPKEGIELLRQWLVDNKINQKREDALRMLRVMREELSKSPAPKNVSYTFERTEMWEHAQKFAGEKFANSNVLNTSLPLDTVFSQLEKTDLKSDIRMGALLRFLMLEEACRQDVLVTQELLQKALDEFRLKHNLINQGDIEVWLDKNNIDLSQFTELIKEEAMLSWVDTFTEWGVASHLMNYLRVTNNYVPLITQIIDERSEF